MDSTFPSRGEKNLPSDSVKSAESPSPCPDSLLVYHPTGAFRTIAAYGALMKMQTGVWQTDQEVKFFASLCYKFNYNGKWGTFQEILERTTNFEEFEVVAREKLGDFTYFGNLLPLVRLYMRTVQVRKDSKKRVRKPQRKRGYDDKGTLRPSHQRGRNFSQPEKEDRRDYVKHPLLCSKKFFGVWETSGGHNSLPGRR